jgi:hypothetical protein
MLSDPEKEAQGLVLVIKFLKDNSIVADPDLNEALNKIAEKVDVTKLPFSTSSRSN